MTDPSGFDASGPGVAGGAFAGELLGAGLISGGIQHLAAGGAAGAGPLAGGVGFGANLALTASMSPFGGSAASSYNLAAPSTAPSTNPVRPGGMDATAAGAATTPLKWSSAGRPSNWGQYLAEGVDPDTDGETIPGVTQYVETAEGDVVETAVYGAQRTLVMRPFVQPEPTSAWSAPLEPFEPEVELERPDCPCHEPNWAAIRNGRDFEQAVRRAFDTGPQTPFEGESGRSRIADGMNRDLRTLSEAKFTKYQPFTLQLRDELSRANVLGYRFNLFLGPQTVPSGPLWDAHLDPDVNLNIIRFDF